MLGRHRSLQDAQHTKATKINNASMPVVTMRALVALWPLLLFVPTVVGIASASFAATKLVATKEEEVACPSREFSKFMNAFSEDARLQNRFTRFPLEYTYLDVNLIGTEKEDDALKKQMIKSLEAIPFRYGEGKNRLIPNRLERKKWHLETKLVPPEVGQPNLDDKNVLLFKPDTDSATFFRFRRERGCWYLYGIDSRSL